MLFAQCIKPLTLQVITSQMQIGMRTYLTKAVLVADLSYEFISANVARPRVNENQ